MWKERRLGVFENRVLRRIFGPKRGKVTGQRRQLHHQELNGLYCSHSFVWMMKSRRMRLAGHVAHMGERRGVYRVLVGKPKGKGPLWSCASACKTNTTQNQSHQICNTQRTQNKTTDLVIKQHSRKLLMMDILMSETC